MISALLAFILLLSMLPAPLLAEEPGQPPDIQEAAVITGFEAITVDAGTTGSAGYADSEAVIAYLEANHAQVQAITTPDSSTVNIAVTGWTAPSGDGAYNPAVAGSYTFTATLGQLPEVYANPNNLTATAEVVVAEAEGGVASRLEAPAISSAYDEQNNSYTVTISTTTAGAIKYLLSDSENGTGEWLDYPEPFVVDSTHELINQGILYVLAYVDSTEAGVADSEISSTLLDLRGEVDPGTIEDGEYTLPVRLWHAVDNQPSMGNNALEQTASLVVAEGQGALYLTFKSLTFMEQEGYLSQLDLLDNIVFNENNYPTAYDLIPATVLSTYDVVDQFNHPDSTDPNCAGRAYPKEITAPVTLNQEYTWVHVYVPVMGSMGFGDQVARIKLDWSNLAEAGEESIEITAFDPVTIDAGTTASPAYADAAAVIAHLNDNYAGVTANGGAVSVPVTGWTDTDSYNPNTAGSYTFTAALGDIHAGYTLGEGVTATAEVVVAGSSEGGGQVYAIPLALHDGSKVYGTTSSYATGQRPVMFNDYAMVTAKMDGTYRVKLQFYSYSAVDAIQVVNPAQVPGAMQAYPKFSDMKMGTYNLTGDALTATVEGGLASEAFNPYYLQGSDVLIEQRDDEEQLEIGYISFDVPNLEQPVLMKTYSDSAFLPQIVHRVNHQVGYFDAANKILLPDSSAAGNHYGQFVWTNVHSSNSGDPDFESSDNTQRNNKTVTDRLTAMMENITGEIDGDGTMEVTVSLSQPFGRTDYYALEVRRPVGRDLSSLPTDGFSSILGDRYGTTYTALTIVNDRFSYPAGSYEDWAFGKLFKITTNTLSREDAGSSRTYYSGYLHLFPGDLIPDGEITAFDHITVNAGSAFSATYADAAAVIAYLNDNHGSVTAQASGVGAVTVPVTGWADTDGYNPEQPGTYTFTATLGELPAGCTLGDGVTATSEALVGRAVPTVTGVTVSPASATVQKGKTHQFTAVIAGYNPPQDITWSVIGAEAAGTAVNGNGLLSVAADETAAALTVRATATGTDFSGTAAVTVVESEDDNPLADNGLRLVPGSAGVPENAILSAPDYKNGGDMTYFKDAGFDAYVSFALNEEHYKAYSVSCTANGEKIEPQNAVLEFSVPDDWDLSKVLLFVRKSTGTSVSQPSLTRDSVNHKIRVSINASSAIPINSDFVFVDEATAINPQSQIQEEGVYKARVVAKHASYNEQPSMANSFIGHDHDAYIEYKDGAYKLHLEFYGWSMRNMYLYNGNRDNPPLLAEFLEYEAEADGSLEVSDYARDYHLAFAKRVSMALNAPDPDRDDNTYWIRVDVPAMDGVGGGTPGDSSGSKDARLLFLSVEKVSDNPLAGYHKTVIRFQLDKANRLLATLTDDTQRAFLQTAINAAQTVYDGAPGSEEIKAAADALAEAIETVQGEEPVRLEAPDISREYDEQNNSYTVTISAATAGTIKYRLSGNESGTGDWLDYTGLFTVDSTHELINQGILYVSAYTASTETGVEDSEVSQTLLDFRGEVDPGNIEDGEYIIPVSLWHASDNAPSMGNAALEQTASLVVADGQGALQMTFKSLAFMSMEGYLSQLDLLDNIVFNENNYPVDYTLIPATVISTYDVVDQFNDPDSADPNCAGKPYPKDLSVPVALAQEYTWAHVYVPVMGSMGFGDQVARIKLDWNGLTEAGEESIEITAFDPVTIDAGTTASPAYVDAAAVIAHLNANYAGVTANGGAVSVPVTAWTDTDGYNPATAGSYTFTAVLGDIPEGYALGDGVTATAEVVVKTPAEAPVSIPDVNLKAGICTALGQDPTTYTITVGDMESLTALDLPNKGITDLTGLVTAVNLETLDLSGNPIDDANRRSSSFGTLISSNVFGKLTKLKHLDLSGCRLGDFYGSSSTYNSSPSVVPKIQGYHSIFYRHPSLETLDLSDNGFTGAFPFYSSYCENLKTLDLSNNRLTAITNFDGTKFPSLERLDISDNYIYWNEAAGAWINPLLLVWDKVEVGQQKSLADLYNMIVLNYGVAWSGYNNNNNVQMVFPDSENVFQCRSTLGSSVSFGVRTYANTGSVRVTVDGETFIGAGIEDVEGITSNNITLTGLAPGEHVITLDVAHVGGDTRQYTMRITTGTLPNEGEDAAGIVDPILHQALCGALNVDPVTHVITKAELGNLTGSRSFSNITDPEGIQYLTRVTSLSVSGTYTRIPDLSGLTLLLSLTLNGNYTEVPALPPTTSLTLNGNFSNLPALPNNLSVLSLTGNNYNILPALPNTITQLSLAGSFAAAPDVSGLANLNQLTVNTKNLSTPVDVSNNKKMTSYTMSAAVDGGLSDLTGLTLLKTLNIRYASRNQWPTGIENAAGLNATVTLTYPSEGTYSPLRVGDKVYNLTIATDPASVVPGITVDISNTNGAANKWTIACSSGGGRIYICLKGSSDTLDYINSSSSTSKYFSFADDFQGPVVTRVTIRNTEDPDNLNFALGRMPEIKTLDLKDSKGIPALPPNVGTLSKLESLNIYGSEIRTMDVDLRNCTSLPTIDARYSLLSGTVDAEKLPASLTSLDLSNTSVNYLNGSFAHLTNLKTLKLGYGPLIGFPVGIRDAVALETLQVVHGYYGEIPVDTFDKLVNLKYVTLGSWMPLTRVEYEKIVLAEGTVFAEAIARLKTAAPNATIYFYEPGSGYDNSRGSYSALVTLESSVGEISGAPRFGSGDLRLNVPEDTQSVTLTPNALLSDTTISVGDQTFSDGQPITIDGLEPGLNTVTITCYNSFENYLALGTTTTYTLHIVAGEYDDTIVEGRYYQIGIQMLKKGTSQLSMSGSYFLPNAIVRLKDGKYEVRFTVNDANGWIPYVGYYYTGESTHTIAETLETSGSKTTYRAYAATLDEPLVIRMQVVPMANSFVNADMVFDISNPIDITSRMPQVDKTDLVAAINEAETELAKTIYTDASYNALKTAADAAKAVNADADATEEEVTAAATALNDAIAGLEIDQSKLADKTALEAALDEAKAIQQDNHSATAWNALQDAIAEAQELYDRLEATQEEVAAAVVTLTAAIARFNSEVPGGHLDPDNLPDGEYTIPVRLWHSVNNAASMGDAALEQSTKLVVEDSAATLHLNFKPLEFMGLTGYLSQLDLLDNVVLNENNYPTVYDLIPATVLSTYDVVDDFNKPDSSDPNCAGKPYPKEITLPVTLNQEYTWVHVYVPVMGSMGFGDQVARIKLDWSGLAVAGDPDPDAAPVHEINDDGDGVIEITAGDLSGISDPRQNVGLSAGGASINIPAQYLSGMLAGGSGTSLKLEVKESPADTQTAVFQLITGNDELAGAFDVNLSLGEQSVTDLGGRVKITFSLTDAQVTALQNADSRKLCHYDFVTGTLTDMNAVFDLAAKTVTLYTDHLSTYVLIATTAPGSGGSGGSDPGSSHGLANGTYNIKVKALQEYANDESMANQFFTERAELKVAGEKITVTVVMHGTATSAELSSGIKMSYINALQYKNSSGSWGNAVSSRDNTGDTLTVRMTVSSLDDLYMRVQTDYMGPEYKVFRLVFNRSSLQEGRLTPAATPEKQDVPGLANTDAKVFTGEDGVQVRFPDSALSGLTAPVQITIAPGAVKTLPQAEKTAVVLDPSKYQRQFGIEGMTDGSIEFKAPVTITFPISLTDLPQGVTTAQLAVYWWNPSRNDWVKLGGVFNPQDNSISVPVYHFSTYAVMADTGATPERLAGEDRFGTAVAISQHGWKAGADSVVLANAYAFPDALAAGPLAYKLNAPILLSDARTLTPVTLAEMQRLAPKKIILIGGTAVLSQAIEDSLSAVYGQDNVIRYGGADRYATAAAIASALGTTGQAVIANGEDGHYADALAISSYAAYHGAPILFTAAQALPDVSKQALTEQKVSASIVAGGEGAVSAGIYRQLPGATRYGGADRYATATTITAGLKLNLSQVFVTTGLNFPDALVAGNLAARSFSPLLLVDKDLPQTVQDFLAANKEAISGITVVGGEKVISTEQQSALQNAGGNKLPLPDAGTSDSAPADGKYTVEARALKEKSDELSMADQFLTEKARLTVNNGAVAAAMTWHGTEFITMDMLKELKYQKADGSFADVNRVFNSAANTLAINFEIADINKPTIMQVYAPAGMGESRPKFRLVFDPDTLAAVN
jgi:heme-binding NEAT domain protein/putative cell wall-binding protein/Leucine-rich repeat (LRR) protein